MSLTNKTHNQRLAAKKGGVSGLKSSQRGLDLLVAVFHKCCYQLGVNEESGSKGTIVLGPSKP